MVRDNLDRCEALWENCASRPFVRHKPSEGCLRRWRAFASDCSSQLQGVSACHNVWHCCCCCCFDVTLSGSSLITLPRIGINLHCHMPTLMVACYLSVIVVFHHDNFGTKTLPRLMHKCTSHACYIHTHFDCLQHPPSAVVPHPLSLAPLKSYSHDTPQPHGAFSCPSLGPSNYYTRWV